MSYNAIIKESYVSTVYFYFTDNESNTVLLSYSKIDKAWLFCCGFADKVTHATKSDVVAMLKALKPYKVEVTIPTKQVLHA